MKIITIEILDPNAIALLEHLESLNLIKMLTVKVENESTDL